MKSLLVGILSAGLLAGAISANGQIIHDAEQAILQEQFGDQWATQDKEVAKKLAALEKKFGKKPNIIHIMWDDNSFGEVGIEVFNKIRGFETPRLNQMGEDGITFTRMYTEPSCTPTRAAALTGRLAVRSGMHTVAFPPEGAGLAADEVTIAEVLSQAGYNTAFFGKAHQGDIEESYMHNQGFDEAQFSMYNQFPSMFWHRDGEMAQTTIGYTPTMTEKKYLVDGSFRPTGFIFDLEGKKGEKATETLPPTSIENYRATLKQHQEKALDYIKRKAGDDKPFYMAYWPHVYDLVQKDMKITTSNGTPFAQNIELLDKYIGAILDELKAQGISENTLVVCMADNGPMKEVPNAMYQVLFTGGKGDYQEGGIRVAAFAQWDGMVNAGEIVGDMVTVHDLFTTFASLGGATKYIPTDRIIDGIDQTAVFTEGDGNSRRDYYHVYTGPIHAATIKQQYKRVWVGDHAGLVGANFYDLYLDPKEMRPMMAQFLWAWGPFDMVKARHDALIAKYPNRPVNHGIPFGGVTNLRPESKKYIENYKDAFESRMKH